jgi:RNase P subunit RPR2
MATVKNKEDIVYGEVVTMLTVTCYSCGVPFGMPDNLNRRFRDTQENFYCPNGHGQRYSESTEAKLKKQMQQREESWEKVLAEKEKTIEYVKRDRDRIVTQRTVLKGKITKITNRIKNGVCPCCNRQFSDLASHMQVKHPNYKAQ